MTKEEFSTIDKNLILILDIREDDEVVDLPCLPGALHIPMSRLLPEIEIETIPKDRKVVTVCYSGGRCHGVNQALAAHGYEVDMLEGGMSELSR